MFCQTISSARKNIALEEATFASVFVCKLTRMPIGVGAQKGTVTGTKESKDKLQIRSAVRDKRLFPFVTFVLLVYVIPRRLALSSYNHSDGALPFSNSQHS